MKALLKTASFSLFFIFSLFFSPWAGGSIVPVDPCYSPLEIAALFSASKDKKPSLKSQMKKVKKQLEKQNKQLERLQEGSGSDYNQGIEGHIDKLANSLDKQTEGLLVPQTGTYRGRKDKTSTVADDLASYMESRQDGWDCEEDTPSTGSRPGMAANTSDMKCRDWQQGDSGYFGSNGKVNNSFCDDYANNPKDCKDALKKLKRDYQRVSRIERQIADLEASLYDLEDQQWEREYGEGSDEDEDESGGICISCLKELRAMNGPSGGQVFGNVLTMGLGAALSVFGIREGRKMGAGANEMLALQGFPAQNNLGYSLAGASLGFPFIGRGLHGLTQANAARGGYGCSPTSSPHSHMNPMLAMQMQQYQMQQMQFQNMMNPFAMNPMMQFQMQNPFASPFGMNPMMGFQMQNPFASPFGMNPMMGFQMQNPFASPFGMNPMMGFQMQNPFASPFGMNPMMGFQMQNPFGMNPMMGFQMQNPFAMNPMMQMPGMNPMFSTQYSQQAMQAMQTRMQMQMQIQQAYFAQQQSLQQDWMRRQQVIGSLTQELFKIQSQIRLVSMGGVSSMAGPGALNTGLLTGQTTGGPQHNPTTSPGTGKTDDLPVVIGR